MEFQYCFVETWEKLINFHKDIKIVLFNEHKIDINSSRKYQEIKIIDQ